MQVYLDQNQITKTYIIYIEITILNDYVFFYYGTKFFLNVECW